MLGAIELAPGAEVTIEANPEDVTDAWAAAASGAGATRVSLGVQSLDPVVLRGLGRAGRPAAVAEAAGALGRAGLSYSVDLIVGGAGETDESFEASLSGVLHLEPSPSHLSAYALTVEKGTPLHRDASRHPDDDVQAARYELADALVSRAGFSWYEISNWAKPGAECRHNWVYWEQGDYLGIGAAAHGHRAGHRWWNVKSPERYIAAMAEGGNPIAGEERVGRLERATEALELGLRTRTGVPSAHLPDDEALHGLVTRAEGRAVLTLRGRLLANEVACRLQPFGLQRNAVGAAATA